MKPNPAPSESPTPSVSGEWFARGLLGVFCVGLLAVWVIPGNAADAQNREPVAYPVVTASSVSEELTFRQVDAAIRDRIGAQVVVANALANASVHLLGRSPIPEVVLSPSGQPFFSEDFLRPCRETESSLSAVKTGLADDQRSFNEAGKYILYMVAPDKSSIRRDDVDAISPDLLRCSDFVREHFETWAAEGQLPLVPLWDQVTALDGGDTGAYMFNDTHWNAAGSMAMTATLMERLVTDQQVNKSILSVLDTPIFSAPEAYTTDLDGVMGLNETNYRETASFDRPDVTTVQSSSVGPTGASQYHFTSVSGGGALVPGKTLLLGDSFTLTQMPTQLANLFEDITIADHHEYEQAGGFDRVIVERVQRYGATEDWPSLTETLK
jgi:hypothetical protein